MSLRKRTWEILQPDFLESLDPFAGHNLLCYWMGDTIFVLTAGMHGSGVRQDCILFVYSAMGFLLVGIGVLVERLRLAWRGLQSHFKT
jgi:hypothetical protein